jgi:replicative DNA helicase Mcm
VKVEAGPEDKLREFLRSFQTETGEHKYRKRLAQAAVAEARSIVIDFEDLISFDPVLSREVTKKPDEILEYANRAAWTQMKIEDPEYAEQVQKILIRFRKIPEKTQLREIGSEHVGTLIIMDGIVVRSTPVKPLITNAVFRCPKCNKSVGEIPQTGFAMKAITYCPYHKQTRVELDEKHSTFINFQELRVQERPEDLPPGQLPRSIDVFLTEDLVDVARPGDRVSLTGVVRTRQETSGANGKLRSFELFMDGNFVDVVGKEAEVVEISPEDEKKILDLSRDPWLHRKLLMSLAPSIYGYADIKEALLYLLFGGSRKTLPDGVTIRGDANVLLVGDPGTAKSALLQYVARTAPRGLYTSGRGSTAAGLTAAVLREKTGGMVLEAGALVLADKGVAAIDEIDKMRPDDRVAIHEAMEQQTVSVAKGGIVATLNARASVLAAANPALGRYDAYKLIAENINLPVTILSRFDLIFVVRDVPDIDLDAKMSEHILTLHRKGVNPEEVPVPQDLLRKYISYAKRIEPILSEEAEKELRNFYLKMRSVSASSAESPIAITPRQLEALVRLSEARARVFLRDKVSVDDARAVIRLMNASLQDVGIDTTTGKTDIDIIMTGKSKSLRDAMQLVRTAIADLEKETGTVEEATLYETLSKKSEIEEDVAKKVVSQLLKEGLIYSPKPGHLKRTSS